ncbi:MAG: preprotein translocase subunit SecG [candidate division NC10 bacterium]|nr:preprotein translocase subunit SecG [candidate division NC10 bacterium]
MYLALAIVHLIMCFLLILIVLLQTGKGAQMGSAFGSGASQTIFGTRGATTFLGKLTTVAAIIFMLTSLSLAVLSSRRSTTSIVEETTKAPVAQPAAPSAEKQPSPPATPTSPPSR